MTCQIHRRGFLLKEAFLTAPQGTIQVKLHGRRPIFGKGTYDIQLESLPSHERIFSCKGDLKEVTHALRTSLLPAPTLSFSLVTLQQLARELKDSNELPLS